MLVAVAGCIVLTWVLCAAILVGIGSLVLRCLDRSFHSTDAFWVGLAASVAFLQIWNLFSPVNAAADLPLAVAGLAGLCLDAGRLFRNAVRIIASNKLFLIAYAGIVAVIGLRAAGPCEHFDTGLYGAQAVRWLVGYPAVLGLANVHGRFGFNTSVFLCDAALDHGPWRDLYFHVFPGLLLFVFWIPVLRALQRVFTYDSASTSDWFHTILVIPASWWSARGYVVGTTTDEPTAIVALVAAGILFQWLAQDWEATAYSEWDSRLFTAATLFSLVVTFKLSMLVFAVVAWGLLFLTLWSKRRSICLKAVFPASLLVLAPWLVRGIITSGYPFFPDTAFGFPVDWRVPTIYTKIIVLWVRSWSRIPNVPLAETQGLAWLRPWLHSALRHRSDFPAPVTIAALGSAAILLLRSRPSRLFRLRPLWLLLPSIAGLLFWLVKAPALRFATADIWTGAATLGALGIALASEIMRPLRPRLTAAAILGAAIWCVLGVGWQQSYQVLDSVHGFVRLPEAPVTVHPIQSGLVLSVPISEGQCWDAPIPCAPYFKPTLRLRHPPDFRGGFRSQGLPKVEPQVPM